MQKCNLVLTRFLIEQISNCGKNWGDKVIAQKANIYTVKKKTNKGEVRSN